MDAEALFHCIVERLREAVRNTPFDSQETADKLAEALEEAIETVESVTVSAEQTLEAFRRLWEESLKKLLYKKRRAHYAGARGDKNKRFPRHLRKPRRHSPRWSVAATGE